MRSDSMSQLGRQVRAVSADCSDREAKSLPVVSLKNTPLPQKRPRRKHLPATCLLRMGGGWPTEPSEPLDLSWRPGGGEPRLWLAGSWGTLGITSPQRPLVLRP